MKYYILVKQKLKLPSLLLNGEDDDSENTDTDRVAYFTKKKTALKMLRRQREDFKHVKYTLLKEVE